MVPMETVVINTGVLAEHLTSKEANRAKGMLWNPPHAVRTRRTWFLFLPRLLTCSLTLDALRSYFSFAYLASCKLFGERTVACCRTAWCL